MNSAMETIRGRLELDPMAADGMKEISLFNR
jgi:hypothetical protein